jgi:hypothetical protein
MFKNLQFKKLLEYICTHKISNVLLFLAEVAQLVELQPSKLVVASSSLVFRSIKKPCNPQGFFCYKLFISLSGAISKGGSLRLKTLAVKGPFRTIEFPFTVNQLPSRKPITGSEFKW